MNINLKLLKKQTESKSLARGEEYYQRDLVRPGLIKGDQITAQVSGTTLYDITITSTETSLSAFCTCPFDGWGYCKHIVATALAYNQSPSSFKKIADIEQAIRTKNRSELANILIALVEAMPELIEDFGLVTDGKEYNPGKVLNEILSLFNPPNVDIELITRRLKTVIAKAKSLEKEGCYSVTRSIYFVILDGCLRIDEGYGSAEIFPPYFLAEVAEKYQSAAFNDPEFEEIRKELASEIQQLLKYDYLLELEGVDLDDLWGELEEQ